MIITILDNGVVVDTVHVTFPASTAKLIVSRKIRSGPGDISFPTPAPGPHVYSFRAQLESGDPTATVPALTGIIIAELTRV